jgi:hypothetical protein
MIENLVKNAIDAMKGRGKLALEIQKESHSVKLMFLIAEMNSKPIQISFLNQDIQPKKEVGAYRTFLLTKRIVEEYQGKEL